MTEKREEQTEKYRKIPHSACGKMKFYLRRRFRKIQPLTGSTVWAIFIDMDRGIAMKDRLLTLYRRVLSADYTTIAGSGASFCYEIVGSRLNIFFESSNGKVDWSNNFDFPAKAYRDMDNRWYVHRGFLRVWKSAREYLKRPILDRSVREIVVAGYSHGAALALLCHEFCMFHRPDIAENIRGYGFGCPRVVFGVPAKNVRGRFRQFYVIRNCRDLVTHLPPFLLGFRHVGNMVHIGKKANYGPIDSHRAENYIEQLSRCR